MRSNDNLNRSHTEPPNRDLEWAKEAVKAVVDIAVLNASIVQAGLFPSYIHEMESNRELICYHEFLIAMYQSRKRYMAAKGKL